MRGDGDKFMVRKKSVVLWSLLILLGTTPFSFDKAEAAGSSLQTQQDRLLEADFNDFMKAVQAGDVETAKSLMANRKIDINQKDARGFSAMYYAILQTHQIEMVKLLKQEGATMEPDWLIEAVRQNSHDNQLMEMVKLLVSYGMDVNYKNESGFSAIYYAILHNNQFDMVKLLKEAGATIDPNWFVQAVRQNNFYNNYEAMVKLLLSYRMDVNHKNEAGYPAIYYAILYNNQTEMVKLLKQTGATIDPHWFVQAVQKNNSDNNYEEMVKLLMSYGIDINHKDKSGHPAIYYSIVEKNQLNIARLLKEAGAKIEPEWLLEVVRKNDDENHYLNMVQLLLLFGVDVNFKDAKGESALSIASKNNQVQLVNLLKDWGATLESEADPVYKSFESRKNVEQKKEWKVKLNYQIDGNSLSNERIYVVDHDGVLVPTEAKLDKDQTTILVSPLQGGYKSGESYTLYIKNLRAVDGRLLKVPVKMEFTVN